MADSCVEGLEWQILACAADPSISDTPPVTWTSSESSIELADPLGLAVVKPSKRLWVRAQVLLSWLWQPEKDTGSSPALLVLPQIAPHYISQTVLPWISHKPPQ